MAMFDAQLRSGPTETGRTKLERTRSSLTMRKTGSGQSPQCFRKKKENGRHVSKKASQLDTTTATELAKAFSSGIRHSSSSLIRRARNFLPSCRSIGCVDSPFRYVVASQKWGRTGFDS